MEEGWFEHPAAELIAPDYLAPLTRARVDALVLGCTHYPLLKPLLQRVMGPDVRLIDSGQETAGRVAATGRPRLWHGPRRRRRPTHRFAVSDDEAQIPQVGSRFIGSDWARLRSCRLVRRE